MKTCFHVLIFFLLPTAALFSQVGVNAAYRWNTADEWVEQSPGGQDRLELLADGYSVGLDYWFRLKNVRVEFLPELNYGRYEQSFADGRETNLQALSFFFNTNFYLFDLLSDCDCPTFSKQDDLFKKGFFVQVSPGLSYLMQQGQAFTAEAQPFSFEDNAVAFSIGAAIGLDLGLSDLLTLTPLAGLRYYPAADWSNLNEFTGGNPNREIADTQSSILQYYAGLRVGLRFAE